MTYADLIIRDPAGPLQVDLSPDEAWTASWFLDQVANNYTSGEDHDQLRSIASRLRDAIPRNIGSRRLVVAP